MKNFVKSILVGKQISIDELYQFIAEYCELCNKPLKNGDIDKIIMAIQHGIFDLRNAIENYCKLKKWQIVKLISSDNRLLRISINDE